MSRLNRSAARLAHIAGAQAATDVTGFGLLGHAHEMAHLSGINLRINYGAVHWLPGAVEYGELDFFPGGMGRNRDYFEQWVTFDKRFSEAQQHLLFDPQTSGGLLIALRAEEADSLCADLIAAGDDAVIIGEALPGEGKIEVY
jgi:selenide,water dikinase